MPYQPGAKVKLTRDTQVTGDGPAGRPGLPGPLFLAQGLEGIVTGVAEGPGGVAEAALASFDQQIGGARFDAFTTHMLENLRQQVIGNGAFAAGAGSGARTRYRVQFVNGFVLDGLEEDWLAGA
ncbi:hypothetical protein RMN57_07305 [Kitasatospora sp. CM 4170]|uniref:Uncharacterized protein n=1 Tax=Kitasatospora aburaviensis TaxID=67265 RepID=A0ABW1EQ11_9ACTN|nr:hypothetical protein [Kitasatospora sp. CM 4170]WNM44530.1 hypothetical protein RMN57_07305 [Kitasatospora sp. CM 4170]